MIGLSEAAADARRWLDEAGVRAVVAMVHAQTELAAEHTIPSDTAGPCVVGVVPDHRGYLVLGWDADGELATTALIRNEVAGQRQLVAAVAQAEEVIGISST